MKKFTLRKSMLIIGILLVAVLLYFNISNKNNNNEENFFDRLIEHYNKTVKNNPETPEEIKVYCREMSNDFESCRKSSICRVDDPCSIPDSEGMHCFGLGTCEPK